MCRAVGKASLFYCTGFDLPSLDDMAGLVFADSIVIGASLRSASKGVDQVENAATVILEESHVDEA